MTTELMADDAIDREKLKIASFRTKEGVWADFIAAASKVGLTGTDVLKAAMDDFMAGEYMPKMNTGIHTSVITPSITKEEVESLINTAISTASMPASTEFLMSKIDDVVKWTTGIRDDLNEKLEAIEQRLDHQPPAASKAHGKVELTIEDLKMVKRFEADPKFRVAAATAITEGGTSAEIAQRLLAEGYGTTSGTVHSSATISRMRKAIQHLETKETNNV